MATLGPFIYSPSVTPTAGAQCFNDWYLIEEETSKVTSKFSFKAGTVRVYRNGLRETLEVDYQELSSTELTFTEALLPGDKIILDYELL